VLELLPPEQLAFQRMLDTIRRGFERFGFLPVETPAFELTSVLLTKTGGETEKQVYFVQSTGAIDQGKAPELALRFDLTVPLARYVAEHEHELNFPFRRYQIQRVYRGERNQKGRFREFYQCDIDVIGKDGLALAYDAELPALIHGIFTELAIGPFTIYVNNRKLLRGVLETVGIAEGHDAVLHEIDRLGKTPRAEIEQRLAALVGDRATRLLDILTAPDALDAVKLANATPALTEGLAELRRVHDGTLALGVPASACKINLAIVRGLDYYTGTVYETFLDKHPTVGSICSGGRYENLAGHYTKSKLPGVGISIGATRLFWQLCELDRAGAKADPPERVPLLAGARSIAQVLVCNVDPARALDYARIATELRAAGLAVEVYGADDKLGKQLKYADRAKVPVALLWDGTTVKLKNFRVTAERAPDVEVARDEIVTRVREMLA
jgi:histidyl-tRNA synthetase